MLYVVTVVLIFLLAAASCVALLLGVLGEAGVLRYSRCQRCAHLVVTYDDTTAPTCLYCRHTRLTHPFRALRQATRELVHH